jgi:hypothetical protein
LAETRSVEFQELGLPAREQTHTIAILCLILINVILFIISVKPEEQA